MKNNHKSLKRGISLIVLVITIIVMIVLASTVIISLSSTDIISEANSAVSETDYKNVISAAQLKYAELNIKDTTNNVPVGEYIRAELIKDNVITKEQADKYKFKNNGDVLKLQTKEEYEKMYPNDLDKKYYTITDGEFILNDVGKAAAKDGTLTQVTIPYGVTGIGENAFLECTSITKIIMPDTVTSIGLASFAKCTNLREFVFSKSIKKIGYNSFASISLTSNRDGGLAIYEGWLLSGKDATGHVVIPNDVDHIGQACFKSNLNITQVTIPDTVSNIEYDAFTGAKNLSKVYGAKNLIYIDGNAFYQTAVYNNLPEGPVYMGKVLCKYIGEAPQVFEIKEGTVSIARVGMGYHSNLETLIVPESLKLIRDMGFYYCPKLAYVTFKGNLDDIEIEVGAFEGTAIESKNPELADKLYEKNENIFDMWLT